VTCTGITASPDRCCDQWLLMLQARGVRGWCKVLGAAGQNDGEYAPKAHARPVHYATKSDAGLPLTFPESLPMRSSISTRPSPLCCWRLGFLRSRFSPGGRRTLRGWVGWVAAWAAVVAGGAWHGRPGRAVATAQPAINCLIPTPWTKS
jgi:hypothetical protein